MAYSTPDRKYRLKIIYGSILGVLNLIALLSSITLIFLCLPGLGEGEARLLIEGPV